MVQKHFSRFSRKFRPFGLKTNRLRQWLEVIKEEGKQVGWVSVARDLFKAVCGFAPVNPVLWRKRVRICSKCPLFDRQLKRCRPYSGSNLGCGCYVPLKTMQLGACWAKINLPDSGLGWESAPVSHHLS